MSPREAVAGIPWFHADPPRPGDPWAPFLAPVSQAWVLHLLDALGPGRVVADPFSRVEGMIRGAVQAGHSALALGALPVYPLVLRLHLRPPPADRVRALHRQWASCPVAGGTLTDRTRELFAAECRTCGNEVLAHYFLWQRGEARPVAVGYRCAHCQVSTQRPLYGEPAVVLEVGEGRPGHFWYLLRRVVTSEDPLASAVSTLLDLYTPRQQALLAAMLQCLERLDLDVEERHVGRGLMLAALWAGLPLWSHPYPETWPARWQRPNPYVEHNPWHLVERGVDFLSNLREPLIPWSYHLSRWLEGRHERPSVLVLASPAQQVATALPAETVGLLATVPLPPVGPQLALATLWTGLLFGPRAVEPLRPLLRARRVNWQMTLEGLVRAFAPWARGPARQATWALHFPENTVPAALVWHVLLAHLGAALEGHAVQLDPGEEPEVRARWHLPGRQVHPPVSHPQPPAALAESAVRTVEEVIQLRGEPLREGEIWPFVYARWDQEGLLSPALVERNGLSSEVRVAVEGALKQAPNLRPLSPQGVEGMPAYWLRQPPRVMPLTDRVEAATWHLLRQRDRWRPDELWDRLCERFSGWLTPAPSLVAACLAAYAVSEHGHVSPRPEDTFRRRREELLGLAEILVEVGTRLGYRVLVGRWVRARSRLAGMPSLPQGAHPFHIAWQREREGYVFAFTLFGLLTPWLDRPLPAEHITPCLVLPSSRVRLVTWRLRANPLWWVQVREQGWVFLRFHRLRWLASLGRDVDRHAWQQALGLTDADRQPGLL